MIVSKIRVVGQKNSLGLSYDKILKCAKKNSFVQKSIEQAYSIRGLTLGGILLVFLNKTNYKF